MEEDKGMTVVHEDSEFEIFPVKILELTNMVIDDLEEGRIMDNEDAINLLKEISITIYGLSILLTDVSDELDRRDAMNAQHYKNVKNVTIN